MSNPWLNLILNSFVLDKHSLELWGAFFASWNVYGGLIVRAKCQRIRIKQGIESTSCRAKVTQAAYLHLSMLCTVTVCFSRRIVEKPWGSYLCEKICSHKLIDLWLFQAQWLVFSREIKGFVKRATASCDSLLVLLYLLAVTFAVICKLGEENKLTCNYLIILVITFVFILSPVL